jgi:hypothetical protein
MVQFAVEQFACDGRQSIFELAFPRYSRDLPGEAARIAAERLIDGPENR